MWLQHQNRLPLLNQPRTPETLELLHLANLMWLVLAALVTLQANGGRLITLTRMLELIGELGAVGAHLSLLLKPWLNRIAALEEASLVKSLSEAELEYAFLTLGTEPDRTRKH